jgi:hypothetical protein
MGVVERAQPKVGVRRLRSRQLDPKREPASVVGTQWTPQRGLIHKENLTPFRCLKVAARGALAPIRRLPSDIS